MFHSGDGSSSYNSNLDNNSISYLNSISKEEKYQVKIPKILMQTWKTRNVPEHWKSSPKSIQRLMPKWKYVLMSDEDNRNFIKKYFPEYLKVYDNLEYPIMKCDMIRYAFLYIHGGIYMDLDIELTKPLADLFHDDADIYVVESGNACSVYTNSFLASKPRCKFWLDCLEEIKKPYPCWAYGKHLKVMTKTGPLMLTRVIKRKKYDYCFAKIKKEYVMPCSVCEIKPCTKPGAYTKSLEGSSWCGWDSYIYNTCLCNWKKIVFFILIIFLILFFYLFA